MKLQVLVILASLVGAACARPQPLSTEVVTNAGPLTARAPAREERGNLTPEERAAMMKEMREQHRQPVISAEMQQRREELSRLSPEQRRIKVEEWRKQGTNAGPVKASVAPPSLGLSRERRQNLATEERPGRVEAWRKSGTNAVPVQTVDPAERRAAVQERLKDLRAKKAAGQLSPDETRRLERLEQAQHFLRERATNNLPAAK